MLRSATGITDQAARVLLKVIDNAKIDCNQELGYEIGYKDGVKDAMQAILCEAEFVLTQINNGIKFTVERS